MSRRQLLIAGGGQSFVLPEPVYTTLTPDGTPQTIVNDANHHAFPGVVRLDGTRVLCVWRRGTTHLAGGDIYGSIGTLEDDNSDVASWGTPFLVYSHATLDVRFEDGIAVIDDQLVIAFRLYDQVDNQSPSLIICDDAPASFTSSSTWGSPISIPLSIGSDQNYTQGHVHKVGSTYFLGMGHDSGTHVVGVWRWTGTLADPSGGAFVTVGSGANDYAEICIAETSTGLLALMRSETNDDTDKATSTDTGATWSAVSNAHDGYGYPMVRLLTGGIMLTVFRDSPAGDNMWRQSTDEGVTWSAETLLDATGARSGYASAVQLTDTKTLCVYACEATNTGTVTDSDIFSQVFTAGTGESEPPPDDPPEPSGIGAGSATAGVSGACSVTVADGGDIQAAIDAASNGDVVCLTAGGDYELTDSLLIDSFADLTLDVKGALVHRDSVGTGFAEIIRVVSSTNMTIRNMRERGSHANPGTYTPGVTEFQAGIAYINSSGLVEFCDIRNNYGDAVGIYGASSDVTVQNITAIGNGRTGFAATHAERIVYRNCLMENNGFAYWDFEPDGGGDFVDDVLIEDCELGGVGKHMVGVFGPGVVSNVTVRRVHVAAGANRGIWSNIEQTGGFRANTFLFEDCTGDQIFWEDPGWRGIFLAHAVDGLTIRRCSQPVYEGFGMYAVYKQDAPTGIVLEDNDFPGILAEQGP